MGRKYAGAGVVGLVDIVVYVSVNWSAGNFLDVVMSEAISGGSAACVMVLARAVAIGVLVFVMANGCVYVYLSWSHSAVGDESVSGSLLLGSCMHSVAGGGASVLKMSGVWVIDITLCSGFVLSAVGDAACTGLLAVTLLSFGYEFALFDSDGLAISDTTFGFCVDRIVGSDDSVVILRTVLLVRDCAGAWSEGCLSCWVECHVEKESFSEGATCGVA